MVEINTESTCPISIIIITLNEEARLPRLLAQIEQQTYQNIQLIVSDSNSSDHTREKAEEYRHIGHNFIFHQCGVTK
jgi:glycosyltransferase involved in cell wall biosynthesis